MRKAWSTNLAAGRELGGVVLEVHVLPGHSRDSMIRSLRLTIPPRGEQNFRWVTTHQVRPGAFIMSSLFYNVRHESTYMNIFDPIYA